MTTSDPTGVHDWNNETYVRDWIASQRDDDRIPILRRMLDLIPFDPDSDMRVLDIGGGYGAVTKVLLDIYPRAEVVLQDISEPMVKEARSRLANFSDSVSFVISDLLSPEWLDAIDGEFQAVISSRAIHNVRFPDRIRSIYEEIATRVAPGGCFLNFDEVVSAGPLTNDAERHGQLMSRRRRLHDEAGEWKSLNSVDVSASSRRRQMDPHGEASAADLERIAAHEPNTLGNQLRWLTEGGFTEADCVWRDGNRAILAAFKSR